MYPPFGDREGESAVSQLENLGTLLEEPEMRSSRRVIPLPRTLLFGPEIFTPEG